MKRRIPKGFRRCKVCGEFNGTTKARNLSWTPSVDGDGAVEFPAEVKSFLEHWQRKLAATVDPDKDISVSCLCKGRICGKCGVGRKNAPGSNSYDEETNTIWHWPYFSVLAPCAHCLATGPAAKTD